MPTMLSHPAVPLALAGIGGKEKVSFPLLVAAIVASILPDADVLGFKLGIPYQHWLGHRGFFHSISFAILIGLIGMVFSKVFNRKRLFVFLVLFISAASHGLLDALTNGGLGIALLSPFSEERFFFPWQPIGVSPLSIDRFLSPRGRTVLESELVWIWVPCLFFGMMGIIIRKIQGPKVDGY
jgi:inner membrane protein